MVFIDFLQFQGLVCSGSLLFLSQLKTRSGGGDGGVAGNSTLTVGRELRVNVSVNNCVSRPVSSVLSSVLTWRFFEAHQQMIQDKDRNIWLQTQDHLIIDIWPWNRWHECHVCLYVIYCWVRVWFAACIHRPATLSCRRHTSPQVLYRIKTRTN